MTKNNNLASLFGDDTPRKSSGGLGSLFGDDAPATSGGLDSLLGDEGKASRPRLEGLLGKTAAGEKRFCRNCRYSFLNAFVCRCTRTGKEVEPMGDCPDYLPRSIDEVLREQGIGEMDDDGQLPPPIDEVLRGMMPVKRNSDDEQS